MMDERVKKYRFDPAPTYCGEIPINNQKERWTKGN
jgi:hypothetical protein